MQLDPKVCRCRCHAEGDEDHWECCFILAAVERDEALARLREVVEAHHPSVFSDPTGTGESYEACADCGQDWPCKTALLLGADPDTGEYAATAAAQPEEKP